MEVSQLMTQDKSPLYMSTDEMKNFHQISYIFYQNWVFFWKSAVFSLGCTDEISILRQSMHPAQILNKLYNNFLTDVAKTHVKPNQ